MQSQSEVVFQLGEVLLAVSRELGASQEEEKIQQYLDSFESADNLLSIKHGLLQKIVALKKNGSSLKPFKDVIIDALGDTFLDSGGLNHLNLPINEWVVQEQLSTINDLPIQLDMNSSLISQLLSEWSSDANKHIYIRNWIECVHGESGVLPDAFPKGLQIVSLSPLLKEGFLKLLIPVVLEKKNKAHVVRIFLRRRLRDEQSHGGSGVLSAQPNYDMVYDLRIKVIPPATSAQDTTSVDASSNSVPQIYERKQQTPTVESGWLSGLMQTGADILDWVNKPAADNSFLEEQEFEAGVRRRGSHGSSETSGAVPQKSLLERERDRAWSLSGSDPSSETRSRIDSTDSANSTGSKVSHAFDNALEQYGIGIPDIAPAYTPPLVLSRSCSDGEGGDHNIGSNSTYSAPVDTSSTSTPAATMPVKSPLSVVEAKLKAMREKQNK